MLPRVLARLRVASRVIRDRRIPLWRRLLWPVLGLAAAAAVALPGPNPIADALAASVIGVPVDGAGFVMLGAMLAPWLTIHGVARRHPEIVAEHQGRTVAQDVNIVAARIVDQGVTLQANPQLARLQRKLLASASPPPPAPQQRNGRSSDFGGLG